MTWHSPTPSSAASDCAMRAAGSLAPASITPQVSTNAVAARSRAFSDMAVSTTRRVMASTPSVNATLIAMCSQHFDPNTRQSLSILEVVSRSERDCANQGTGAQSPNTRQRGGRVAFGPRRMMMQRLLRVIVLTSVALVPATVFAQASIVGTVRDASGAVLPGVTVEATSPALIERARTVITNGV